jgi:hypothetical protein
MLGALWLLPKLWRTLRALFQRRRRESGVP